MEEDVHHAPLQQNATKDLTIKRSNSEVIIDMMKKIAKELLRLLIMTAGSAIYAVAIALFLNPNSLAPGGVSGIAIILNKLTGFPTGMLILIINIPLMVITFFKLGKRLFASTTYVLLISSVFIDVLAKLTEGKPLVTENLLLAGIAGGTLLALGLGIIFHSGGMTGGTDIIVRLLRQKYPHMNSGTIFFSIDIVIITISAITFHNIEIALYALLSVFISSRVLDFVLYSPGRSKQIYIITTKGTELSERFTKELDTGVTQFEAKGAYTGNPKNVLICVVKNQRLPRLRRMVLETDPAAFMTVTDATEVFGLGYQALDKEEI